MSSNHTLSIESPAIPVVLGRPALEPVRLSGREGLNSLFEYELLLKTPDALNLGASGAADFDLDDFIGREISCNIQLDGSGEFIPGAVGASVDHVGAGTRQINAVIAVAAFWGEEGRHLQYKLTLRPWLHLLDQSTDCKIFQNKTVVEILDELLGAYPFPVDKRLFDSYPQRDYQTQHNESDFEFFSRLCQEWGISYHFEHSEGKHRLVLSDAMAAYRENDSEAYRQVEYHAPGWKIDAEYLHSFVPEHQLTSGRYTTRDYDYTRPRADLTQSRSDPRPTGQADGEVYQWHAGRGGSHYAQPRAGTAEANDPQDEGRQLALLRMQALRTHGARARASGNLRGMVPGCTFKLQKHPRQKANAEYLILDTHFLIEDVAQDSQVKDAAPGRKQQWKVEVDFTAHPVTEPLRPALTQPKPYVRGPQSALVVGPEGQNVWTDHLGRIKVQFPWDRIGDKNANSSCWVRVSSPWAGNQLGATHVPRIGQEVIVDFLGGDPDLPICVGRVHNQNNLPSWRLPEQYAISGFRSRELTQGGGNSSAGRSNHLLMDDTPGKIQTQFKSDYLSTSLSLGRITRIEDNAGRKDYRGQGFELRSDGHGAIRARWGLLVTTEARTDAASHVLDSGETLQRLAQARDQHEDLADTARNGGAQDDDADQSDVCAALERQNDEIKGIADAGDAESFPEFEAPHLVLASPAGIESTTPASTHIASGEHVAITSGRHTSVSAAGNLLASVKGAIRLFAYKAGIRIVSALADIDIKALKQSIHLLAKLDVTITANRITITAKEEVLVNGGGSYTLWKAGQIESGTSGQVTVYAASTSHPGPRTKPGPQLPEPPLAKGNLALSLVAFAQHGHLFVGEPYELYRGGALIAKGITDKHGRIEIKDHPEGTPAYKVRLFNGAEFDLQVSDRLSGGEQQESSAGFRRTAGPGLRRDSYPSLT